MPRRQIFVSYRREDSAYVTATIREKLEENFARDSIFMDIDSVPLGMDFRKHLDDAVSKCDVLIAVIGDNWVANNSQTNLRRIDDPADFVRIEVEAALKRNIPVIPVLVGNASMPREQDLPETLRELTFRNATEIRAGRDLGDHLNRLVKGLHKLFDSNPATRSTAETETPTIATAPPRNTGAPNKGPSAETSSTRAKLPPIAAATPTISALPSAIPNNRAAFNYLIAAVVIDGVYAAINMRTGITFVLNFVAGALSIISAVKSRGSWIAPVTMIASTIGYCVMTKFEYPDSIPYVLAYSVFFAMPSAVICYVMRKGIRV